MPVTKDTSGRGKIHSLYICNARILSTTGASRVADIEIIDGIITAIDPILSRRPGIDVYDATGLSVIPALIDLHTHSTSVGDLAAYAAMGVGHIRFAGLDLQSVRAARAFIGASGLGVEIHSCGPMLDMAEVAYPNWTRPVTSVKEAQGAARELIETGEVDALIVTQRATAEVVCAVADEAHKAGIPLVGQTWAIDAAEAARAGIDQLDNSSRVFVPRALTEKDLTSYRTVGERLSKWAVAWTDVDWHATAVIQDEMINRHVAYCPTLVAYELHTRPREDLLSGDQRLQELFAEKDQANFEALLAHIEAGWRPPTRRNMLRAMANLMNWVDVFRKRGGTVVVGTDLPFGAVTIVRELELLVSAGMTPKEAIRSATEDAAKMLTKSPVSGRVEVGQEASVILTNGRPDEDLSALRRPAAVFLRGKEVRLDTLSSAVSLRRTDDGEGPLKPS